MDNNEEKKKKILDKMNELAEEVIRQDEWLLKELSKR